MEVPVPVPVPVPVQLQVLSVLLLSLHAQLHEPTEDLLQLDVEQKLRSASSVEEIMAVMDPQHWAALRCASKLWLRPRAHLWRSSGRTEHTFAAAFFNLDLLKSVEAEWRKTGCAPREVCVDVGQEFGAPPNTFYKPPCVSVYRCGGCCHSEDKQCTNISSTFLSKTLFEITVPVTLGTKLVTISVTNHTGCSCLSKLDVYRQTHSIIRRALPECSLDDHSCPDGQTWNSRVCRCIRLEPEPPSWSSDTHKDVISADVCGPDKDLDVETCQCVCRMRDCGLNRLLERNSCRCVCARPPTATCPLHHTFDPLSCSCKCSRECPRQQPLSSTACTCECNQSPHTCFLKGRRFHRASCSCLRPLCEPRRRRCRAGFVFREEVCRCVPSHWRPLV